MPAQRLVTFARISVTGRSAVAFALSVMNHASGVNSSV